MYTRACTDTRNPTDSTGTTAGFALPRSSAALCRPGPFSRLKRLGPGEKWSRPARWDHRLSEPGTWGKSSPGRTTRTRTPHRRCAETGAMCTSKRNWSKIETNTWWTARCHKPAHFPVPFQQLPFHAIYCPTWSSTCLRRALRDLPKLFMLSGAGLIKLILFPEHCNQKQKPSVLVIQQVFLKYQQIWKNHFFSSLCERYRGTGGKQAQKIWFVSATG